MKALIYSTTLTILSIANSFGQLDTVNFIVNISTDNITADNKICLEFETENFTNIVAFQSELQWDVTQMEYDTSFQTPGALSGLLDFNTRDVNDGMLPFLWVEALSQRQTLPDSTSIFSVCFTLNESIAIDSICIGLDNSLISSEDDNGTYSETDIILINGETKATIVLDPVPVDNDMDGVNADEDCDDNDPNNFPGNIEVCDGQDNDCDGEIDENIEDLVLSCCGATPNSVMVCWDDYPNAVEYQVSITINNIAPTQQTVNDSEFIVSQLNEGDVVVIVVTAVTADGCTVPAAEITCTSTFADEDMDGFDSREDCDDNDPDVFPGNTEICDGKDNNCDGEVDEGLSFVTYYADNDGDGYGDAMMELSACEEPSGYVLDDTDCDDTDADINPDATEIPSNGIDEDCDGIDGTSSTLNLSGTEIRVFPNPVGDMLNINTERELDFSIQLFDLSGREVLVDRRKPKLNLSGLSNGIYMLKITDVSTMRMVSQKIVVSH